MTSGNSKRSPTFSAAPPTRVTTQPTSWTLSQSMAESMSRRAYRVAVIGLAHMHVNELMRRFAELPNVEMVAVADTGQPDLNRSSPSPRAHTLAVAQSEIGIPRTYTDYGLLLERERPDIVLLCPELA